MESSKIVHSLVVLVVLNALLSLTPVLAASDRGPGITIAQVPHAGPGGAEPMEVIGGSVTGLSSREYSAYRVVVYAHAGGQWWVQPTFDSPITNISASGKWETETRLGDIYAAMLV